MQPKRHAPGAPIAEQTAKRCSDHRVVARRRKRNLYTATAAGGLVAVAIAASLLVSVLGGKGSHKAPPAVGDKSSHAAPLAEGTYRLPAAALSELNNVPMSVLFKNAEAANARQATPPEMLPPNAPRLSSNGRPEIIYIGTPFCASCAGERWALVIALSKFGTFKNLSGTTSSDIHPGGPTFSFYGATYTSKYLSFVTDEQSPVSVHRSAGFSENALFLSEQEHNVMTAWDVTPYAAQDDTVPFLYIGGKFLLSGFQYDPGTIWQMDFQAAAKMMTSGTTAISKQVEAAAGFLVGDFCALSHEQPAPVCSQVPSSLFGIKTSSVNW
jgi:Domain of unknown function (DUF929)